MDNRVVVQFRQSGGAERMAELEGIEQTVFPLTGTAPIKLKTPVSLILPTFFNQQLKNNSLWHLLNGIEQSAVVQEIVFVVSDGETPKTNELERLAPNLPIQIVDAPPHNRAASRNAGAEAARHQHLMFLDDDMLIKDWRLADVLVSALLEGKYECALFPRRQYARFPLLFDSWCLGECVRKWRTGAGENPFLFDPIAAEAQDPALLFCFPGCFTLIEKQAYRKLKGFDERFVGWGYEDAEFGLRAMKKLRVLNLFRRSDAFLHIDHPVSPYKSEEFRANWRRFQRMIPAADLHQFARTVFTGEDFPRRRISKKEGYLEPFRQLKAMGVPIDLEEIRPWARAIQSGTAGLFAPGGPEFVVLHGSRGEMSAVEGSDYDVLCLYPAPIQNFYATRSEPRVEIECADRQFLSAVAEAPWMFDHRGVLELGKVANGRLLLGDEKSWNNWRGQLLKEAERKGRAFWLTLAVGLKLQSEKYGAIAERYFSTLRRVLEAAGAPEADRVAFGMPMRTLAHWAGRVLDETKPKWRKMNRVGKQVYPLQVPEIWMGLDYISRQSEKTAGFAIQADDPAPTVICTIEPALPQLIGACMQYLSFRTAPGLCKYLLRIIEGNSGEHRFILSLARAAGIPARLVTPRYRNRYLNKWTDLSNDLSGIGGPILLLDWDIVYSAGSSFPKLGRKKILLRKNPADMYLEMAEIGQRISPKLWRGGALLSSINSGVIAGEPRELARMVERTLEIHTILERDAPETAPWKSEQLAVSLAAGEIGFSELSAEWNVVPASPVADSAVRLWHYNDGFDTTRRLKQELAEPHRVEALLKKLSEQWPAQADRMSKLYSQAIDALGASRFLGNPQKRMPASFPAPEARVLVCVCSSGLSNRLLMICGALRIARMTSRKLLLYWPNNSEVGSSFEDLFTNEFPRFTSSDLDFALASQRVVSIYNSWNCSGPLFTEVAEDGDPDAEIVLLKGWYIPKFRNEEFSGALYRSVLPALADFKPHPEVMRDVLGFPLPRETIGVHIRRVDPLKEFLQSRDEDFERIMEGLVVRNPGLSFFLATDDPVVEEKFRTRFGVRILPRERGEGRDSVTGMRRALADLLLLSRTKAVLGTYWSSFSYTASALGNVPLIVAEESSSQAGLEKTLDQLCTALRTPPAVI